MAENFTAQLDFADHVIVVAYLAATIAVGVWVGRKVKSFTAFFVAGRMMTTPLLISTLVSTYYGLDVTFGVSEVSFEEGVVAWFAYSRPYYLAILVTGLVIVRRLKAFPFLSLPDIAEHAYGKAARVVIAAASFLYNLPILSVIGMGILFHFTLGVSEAQGYLIGASVALAYTLLGGLWADAITDTFQFALMCVTLAIAVPFAVEAVGGFAWLLAHMETKYFALMGDISTGYLLALVFTALSVFVEPGLYQRIFAARDERSVRRALLVGIFLWAAYDWGVTILGIAAAAAVKQNLLPAEIEGRQALIHMMLFALPVGLKGFFIAGILSAAMSTVDSYLLLASGNLVYDFYRPIFRPGMTDAALLKWSRAGIAVALIPCLAIALYFKRITDAWVFMSTVLTATALVPIMAALFLDGRRKSLEGLLSALFGFTSVILYYGIVSVMGNAERDSFVLVLSFGSQTWNLWREYSLFFALPFSALGFVLGSWLSRSAVSAK